MSIRDLTSEQYIELGKLRLNHSDEDFTEILINDVSFEYFNGVSFIIKSDKWADLISPCTLNMFYPDEFMYLLSIGVEF